MAYQPLIAIEADLATVKAETEKIDNAAMAGIATSVSGSLGKEVLEIEQHLHNSAYCMASDGAGSAAVDSLVPYVVTAGNPAGTEGTEIPLYDGSAMPSFGVKGDLNRCFIWDVSVVDKVYIVKMYYGPTNFAAAELMTSFYFIGETNKIRGGAINTIAPRITMGTDKVWATAICETAAATISFSLETHGYAG